MKDRPQEAPKIVRKDDRVTETHPTYGMIGLSRYTCTPAQSFFGSSIKHHSGVSITIKTACKERAFARDRYYAEKHVVEVNITEAQLGEMLANMNRGDGVPCTLYYANGEILPNCPEVHEREQIQANFKEAMTKLTKIMAGVIKMANELEDSKSATKGARTALRKEAEALQCQLTNNLPFIAAQFNETIDDMLVQAKADLNSFTQQILAATGVDAIQRRQVEEKSTKMIE